MIETGCKSTDAAIKRFKEFYGPVNRDNICLFLGVGKSDYWYRLRGILKANFIKIMEFYKWELLKDYIKKSKSVG